jgi:hypothetical protein
MDVAMLEDGVGNLPAKSEGANILADAMRALFRENSLQGVIDPVA